MTDRLFEKAFANLLVSANELPKLLLDLDPTYPGPVRSDDFPAVTLGWLRSAAVLQFQGVLAVLMHPQCAGEAEILLRPLLDALGHVIFIHEGIPDGTHRTPGTRALCLEFGIARQRDTEIAERFLAIDDEDRVALVSDARARLEQVRVRHQDTGCTCLGRSFSAVRETLRHLGLTDRSYAMLHDQWIWSSGAAHSYFPSRLYRAGPDGFTVVGSEVRPGFRAMVLKHAIDVLADLGERILHVNGTREDQRNRLTYWVANFVETPPLRNALRGEFE